MGYRGRLGERSDCEFRCVGEGEGCYERHTSACEYDGDVFDFPTSTKCMEASVHVFGECDLGRATDLSQSLSSVDGVAANADGGTPRVASSLDDTIKELLHAASSLFGPGLVRAGAEELRSLDDGCSGVGHGVRHRFQEEVWPWAEVSVEDAEVVACGAGKGPAHVACFL